KRSVLAIERDGGHASLCPPYGSSAKTKTPARKPGPAWLPCNRLLVSLALYREANGLAQPHAGRRGDHRPGWRVCAHVAVDHHHLGADVHAAREIGHVLVGEADAAG